MRGFGGKCLPTSPHSTPSEELRALLGLFLHQRIDGIPGAERGRMPVCEGGQG